MVFQLFSSVCMLLFPSSLPAFVSCIPLQFETCAPKECVECSKKELHAWECLQCEMHNSICRWRGEVFQISTKDIN